MTKYTKNGDNIYRQKDDEEPKLVAVINKLTGILDFEPGMSNYSSQVKIKMEDMENEEEERIAKELEEQAIAIEEEEEEVDEENEEIEEQTNDEDTTKSYNSDEDKSNSEKPTLEEVKKTAKANFLAKEQKKKNLVNVDIEEMVKQVEASKGKSLAEKMLGSSFNQKTIQEDVKGFGKVETPLERAIRLKQKNK